ncbi:hypothetical protein ACS0TY_000150 [Phlomoides rotata]
MIFFAVDTERNKETREKNTTPSIPLTTTKQKITVYANQRVRVSYLLRKGRLIGIINRIVGLKVADRLKVCDELVQNTNRLDLFMSLP